MVNLIKCGISLFVIVIIAYWCFNLGMQFYGHKNVHYTSQNIYIEPVINNVPQSSNNIKYTDISVKPNGYQENKPTITVTPIIVNPTVNPTQIIVITPTNKPVVNIPSESVTLYKNSEDASKIHTPLNSFDTHDNNLIPKNINYGSGYYYQGDKMVVSANFRNNYNKEIVNPKVKVTGFYNIAGNWIAAKEFDTNLNIDIKPNEEQQSFISYDINGIPPGYYKIQADIMYDNKVMCTISKTVDIL